MRSLVFGLWTALALGCAPQQQDGTEPLVDQQDDGASPTPQGGFMPTPAGGHLTAQHPPLNATLRFGNFGLDFATERSPDEHIVIRTIAVNEQALAPTAFEAGDCIDEASADTTCIPALTADHAGVTEWWHNTPAGLEHGWTIHEPSTADTIQIDVGIDGARVKVGASGTSAAILRPTAAPLHYAGLKAWDADGEPLEARMVSADHGLSIEVDATDAAYPVTVDPWLGSWSFNSGQANARLGYSVSSAGDVNGDSYDDVIMSAPYYDNGQTDEGRVWLFLGSADGLGSEADWTFETDQNYAYLGRYDCAIAGATDLNLSLIHI